MNMKDAGGENEMPERDTESGMRTCPTCGGLYPKGSDSQDDMNGGPKTFEGKPFESDAEGNGFGEKKMKMKGYAKMLARKMNGD